MRIKPGDLVQRRNPQESKSLGVVINRALTNSGNNESYHMKHLVSVASCIQQVCYVYFIEEGVMPCYESDLVIKQTAISC